VVASDASPSYPAQNVLDGNGTTFWQTEPNGAYANMLLGGRDYMIQRNWVNASGGYCAIAY